jgi:hypothetical protein
MRLFETKQRFQSEENSDTRRSMNPSWFKCGKSGHYSQELDCFEPPIEIGKSEDIHQQSCSTMNTRRRYSVYTLNMMPSDHSLIDRIMDDMIAVETLIDTGNSGQSLISRRVYSLIPYTSTSDTCYIQGVYRMRALFYAYRYLDVHLTLI